MSRVNNKMFVSIVSRSSYSFGDESKFRVKHVIFERSAQIRSRPVVVVVVSFCLKRQWTAPEWSISVCG